MNETAARCLFASLRAWSRACMFQSNLSKVSVIPTEEMWQRPQFRANEHGGLDSSLKSGRLNDAMRLYCAHSEPPRWWLPSLFLAGMSGFELVISISPPPQ